MNTNRFSRLVLAAAGLAALPTVGCSQKEKGIAAVPPPASAVAFPTTARPGPGPTAPVPVAAKAGPAVAFAQWSDIKEYDYDLRVQFCAGLQRLEARVDGQIGELLAKRATMASTTSTREWDIAMKEMASSRTYLRAMGEEVRQATRETWDQRKEKVGQAWESTQEAYGKVKSSTTS